MSANKFRMLVFFLILFQAAAIYYRTTLPSDSGTRQAVGLYSAIGGASPDATVASASIEDILYSPEKLLLSDAWLAPVPTFQFGFIVILACFLFAVFSFFRGNRVIRRPFYFISSYFHTLFLSIILINAP
jgi:hypothetical protein